MHIKCIDELDTSCMCLHVSVCIEVYVYKIVVGY